MPWAYVAIGVAFIAGAGYVGYMGYGMMVYLALGAISIGSGLLVHQLRQRHRVEGDDFGARVQQAANDDRVGND
ncbi:MAG: hypothetical protein U5K76_10505 [Woeseiaceae bacterium]|nr:hypothetical protein [Woeseiaceae bacterium]